jgi:DNA modification methylase
MELKAKNIVIEPIQKLVEDPKNENIHSEKQIQALAKIIKINGFRSPIIVSNRTGLIVAGHGRLQAARLLGMEELPVIYQDFENEADELRHRLADNEISRHAVLDEQKMFENLQELNFDLESFDFEEIGLIDFNFQKESDPEKDEIEDNIPTNVETRTKTGDLWILGKHKLLVGDATKIDDVEKLMGEEKAAMILTDPPYNVNYEGSDGKTIQNDKQDNSSFRQFLKDAFINYFAVSHAGAPIYIFHADSEGENFRGAMKESGFKLAQCCIWVRPQFVFGRQDYHWQHEPVLYGWKEGAAHTWMADRKQSTVWNFERTKHNNDHPTMKPISLLEYPLLNSSAIGSVVIDFFGGSGSTLIACEKTGRVCRTIEIDPKYADVILKRYEEYSGDTAKLINS